MKKKIRVILQKEPYKLISRNPLNKIIKQSNDGTNKEITDEKKQLIVPCTTLPRIYGVPRIQKERIPLKPICLRTPSGNFST